MERQTPIATRSDTLFPYTTLVRSRNRARSYRPAEGLEPEFEGLPLDPEPQPGAPFLFTISGLAEEADAGIPVLHPLSDEDKARSEEHTSELQSLTRISYAVFCLKIKKSHNKHDI